MASSQFNSRNPRFRLENINNIIKQLMKIQPNPRDKRVQKEIKSLAIKIESSVYTTATNMEDYINLTNRSLNDEINIALLTGYEFYPENQEKYGTIQRPSGTETNSRAVAPPLNTTQQMILQQGLNENRFLNEPEEQLIARFQNLHIGVDVTDWNSFFPKFNHIRELSLLKDAAAKKYVKASSITQKRIYYQQAQSFEDLIVFLKSEKSVLKKMSKEIMIRNLLRIKTISEGIKEKFKPASNQATEKIRESVLNRAPKETMQIDKPIVEKSKRIRKSRKQKGIVDSIVPQQINKHIRESSNTLQNTTIVEGTNGYVHDYPPMETAYMPYFSHPEPILQHMDTRDTDCVQVLEESDPVLVPNPGIPHDQRVEEACTQSAQHIIPATNPSIASTTMAEIKENVLNYSLMKHKQTVQLDKQNDIMDSTVPQPISIAKNSSTTMEKMKGKSLDCSSKEITQMYEHLHIGESLNTLQNTAIIAETSGSLLDYPPIETTNTPCFSHPEPILQDKDTNITNELPPISETKSDFSMDIMEFWSDQFLIPNDEEEIDSEKPDEFLRSSSVLKESDPVQVPEEGIPPVQRLEETVPLVSKENLADTNDEYPKTRLKRRLDTASASTSPTLDVQDSSPKRIKMGNYNQIVDHEVHKANQRLIETEVEIVSSDSTINSNENEGTIIKCIYTPITFTEGYLRHENVKPLSVNLLVPWDYPTSPPKIHRLSEENGKNNEASTRPIILDDFNNNRIQGLTTIEEMAKAWDSYCRWIFESILDPNKISWEKVP